jgi:hypothetical protein
VHPLAFVALLAVTSLVMVYAMVQLSRAILARQQTGNWPVLYAASWAAILIVIVLFLRGEPGALEANLPIVIAFPLGWLALHWLLVRFAMAIRDAPKPPPRTTPVEDDEDEWFAHEPPPMVTWAKRAAEFAKLTFNLFLASLVIAVGELLEPLHRIDVRLAPYRSRLTTILIVLAVTGFVMFMGGIIRFVLKGGQSGTLANTPLVVPAGVALMIVSLCALGIVAGPPGLKLLVMLVVAFLAVRITISTIRRTRHTPTGP